MGLLKNARMAKTANALSLEVENLWDAPGAYRPVGFERQDESFPAYESLPAVADGAKAAGVTSGDVTVLAVFLLRAIDHAQDANLGMQRTFEAVGTGKLRTVSNYPINRFISPDTLTTVIMALARMGRPEAFREFLELREEQPVKESVPASFDPQWRSAGQG